MKKWRQIWQPYMTRPLIYMIFTRFLLTLCVLLLADHFFSAGAGKDLKPYLFALGTVLYALLAWIAHLRLQGVRLLKVMMLRINPRKKPSRIYVDMIDYVDEQPQAGFEDLEDQEKDLCILGADLFCFAVFLVISLVV